MMHYNSIRKKIYNVIFEANTPAGKAFDVALFFLIGISVLSIMLETVPQISESYKAVFFSIELVTTLLFTLEYFLRIWCSPKPLGYVRSFYGLIDLIATAPLYISLILPGGTFGIAIIRSLRLLRIFRVLKLSRFLVEGNMLWQSLLRSSRKIGVFLFTVLLLCVLMGTVMYVIEGPENGFTSIPLSIYWAIVTLTTVGYGDIAPHTVLGQFVASAIMILGYAIIAVPTGIVTVDLTRSAPLETKATRRTCENCGETSPTINAHFCCNCGTKLPEHVD
ncbi:MAG: ion transporter [Schleiferiaceae bacterium]|jgi:voltage-gated potassium channel